MHRSNTEAGSSAESCSTSNPLTARSSISARRRRMWSLHQLTLPRNPAESRQVIHRKSSPRARAPRKRVITQSRKRGRTVYTNSNGGRLQSRDNHCRALSKLSSHNPSLSRKRSLLNLQDLDGVCAFNPQYARRSVRNGSSVETQLAIAIQNASQLLVRIIQVRFWH